MSPSAHRLLLVAATLATVLGALEAFCRVEKDALLAISHRVRFKLALLRAHGAVDFVALGTSRTNDGLKPEWVDQGRGFSLATPSSSLPTLEFIVTQLERSQATLALVEVSQPQMSPALMDDPPTSTDEAELGDPVGTWLTQHAALSTRRRAFALENLPRVMGLLAAPTLDGSEFFRSRQLAEMVRSTRPPEGVHDDAAWRPVTLSDAGLANVESTAITDSYERIVGTLKAKGLRVVLLGAPVGERLRGAECGADNVALRAAIARRTGCVLLDFTCTGVDEHWFVDGEHLSAAGRARYSRAVGEALRALP